MWGEGVEIRKEEGGGKEGIGGGVYIYIIHVYYTRIVYISF